MLINMKEESFTLVIYKYFHLDVNKKNIETSPLERLYVRMVR